MSSALNRAFENYIYLIKITELNLVIVLYVGHVGCTTYNYLVINFYAINDVNAN